MSFRFKRKIVFMDEHTFILYKSVVRPHIKVANSVWCLSRQRL